MDNENLGDLNLSNDWWDDLSDAQKDRINEGLAHIEAGRVMSSD